MKLHPRQHLSLPRREFPWAAPRVPGALQPASVKSKLGVDYDGDWSRRYAVRAARALLLDIVARPAMTAVASPQIHGLELLEALDPPVIFAANHASHIDTPLLLSSLPGRFRHHAVVGAAADHFFDKGWKAALWSFATAAVPIERQRISRRSADLPAELIAEGWSLIIYPEGGRTPDGWGQTFRGGAAYLAKRTGAPVVPVYLAGTRLVLARGSGAIQRSPTRVLFGAALAPDADEDARRFSARIEHAVAALADEVETDWWTARRRAASDSTPSLSGPSVSPWRRSWSLQERDRWSRAAQRNWPVLR